jgi:hypothetical protein
MIINELERWPGTESNRRRQPFQGCQINSLQVTVFENTRLTRERFGLHLDSSSRFRRVWTPRTATTSQPLQELNLLLRAWSTPIVDVVL